ARDYFYAFTSEINDTARTVVETATYGTYSSSIQWLSGGMAQFAQRMAGKIGVGTQSDVESLIRPESAESVVARSRMRDVDARTGAIGAKGPASYFTAVGVEVGNALVRRIAE